MRGTRRGQVLVEVKTGTRPQRVKSCSADSGSGPTQWHTGAEVSVNPECHGQPLREGDRGLEIQTNQGKKRVQQPPPHNPNTGGQNAQNYEYNV
ncbi:hypothetical protein JOB18_033110 [Solea senegalensis]|uniref:Uncharacterized protein n=1 Tax=Solea senegalensis TaxID=28829 RepID=A0AAV6SAI5_SOLSE|nr:hypothetical protein JOB18_033110 [Solea senegalensis]